MERTSQNKQILEFLNHGFIITPIHALNQFQCFRLSARILELKKQGHNIKSRLHHENGKKFSVYWIEKEVKFKL